MGRPVAVALMLGLFLSSGAFAQDMGLEVSTNLTADQWIDRTDPVEVRLNRMPDPAEGKLAVFDGATDLTGLFRPAGNVWTYKPTVVPLKPGQRDLIVYLVTPAGEWREVARFPLRVRSRGGFEKVAIMPRLDLNNKGQVAEDHFPDSNAPPRDTYQDVTGQGAVQTELVRDGWTFSTQWNVIGVTYENEALRFGEKGEEAPNVDLSSYTIRLQRGGSGISWGHVSFGNNRHLINGFSTRGATGTLKFGRYADFSLSALNSTNVVGWSNFTGLQQTQHRVFGSALGFEFLPQRPGGVRLEATFLDASRLPLNSFNQGFINDAEESNGGGVRLVLSDTSQRFRFDGAYTRSRFTNPDDPLLNQGASVVAVKEETKAAQYADVSYSLLQNKQFANNRSANLSVAYRHERVDPLFRSVAAYPAADRMLNTGELQGSIADVSFQVSHSRTEDNLDDIPSILKTLTRVTSAGAAIPFRSLFGSRENPSPLLPQLTYNFNRTHQFADRIPENSDFSASHVPDQVSDSHNAGLDWTAQKWRAGYHFSYSAQDNRQVGRENADLDNFTNTFSAGLTPDQHWNVGFDANLERAENHESNQTNLTRRFGVNVSWRPTDKISMGAIFNRGRTHDTDEISENENYSINLEGAYRFQIVQRSQAQLFVRFARQTSEANNSVFLIQQSLRGWTVNTGLSVSFF